MSNIFQKYIFYKKEIDKRRGGGKKGQKEGKREGKKQKNFEIMQGDGGGGIFNVYDERFKGKYSIYKISIGCYKV